MHPQHFDTEGPFGLPLKDKQAQALDALLKTLPKNDDAFTLRRLSSPRGLSELLPEDRADVSWITVETPDLAGDLVFASGMDDSIFQLNPIVTLNHHYDQPPVGRSLWRRKMVRSEPRASAAGALNGIKAKTHYPPRPDSWSAADWPPDTAFSLVQSGLLRGKSIGFLPLQLRHPSGDEVQQNPQLQNVRYLIEKWLLLEYACCYLPMQPLALVEEVAKSIPDSLRKALDLPDAIFQEKTPVDTAMSQTPHSEIRTPRFISLAALKDALARRLRSQDFEKSVSSSLQRTWNQAIGIV